MIMTRLLFFALLSLFLLPALTAQDIIPWDTTHWDIDAKAYVLENYKGKNAIYLQQGDAILKNTDFLNGTIEFDVYLTERQGFAGVSFRAFSPGNNEVFYLRPHLSGKPDANQAAPAINGLTPWQLYFGPSYSFPYDYNFSGWTHVRLVVNGSRAQVFLDYSERPHLSWNLVHPPRAGRVFIGGSFAPMHYADFKIDKSKTELIDFKVIERKPIDNLIPEWEISDMFEEKLLQDPNQIKPLVDARTWGRTIEVEEGTACNIARQQVLYGGEPGNTVFAKITINSDRDQIKLFEFGYSDRVVAVLNNRAIYRGTNKWRSRDYRYLGTIGLFDAIYLDLKKGENTLLLAVSEDFGGWLVTGRLENEEGIEVK